MKLCIQSSDFSKFANPKGTNNKQQTVLLINHSCVWVQCSVSRAAVEFRNYMSAKIAQGGSSEW